MGAQDRAESLDDRTVLLGQQRDRRHQRDPVGLMACLFERLASGRRAACPQVVEYGRGGLARHDKVAQPFRHLDTVPRQRVGVQVVREVRRGEVP
ncbi:hypothetical protein ABMX48_32775 [Streptomyces cavourensis]